MPMRSLMVGLLGVGALVAPVPAGAEDAPGADVVSPAGGPGGAAAEGTPALINADEISYDEAARVITATGAVELAHQGRVVYADQISYDEATDLVIARGNVRLFQGTGDVVSGDYAELTGDLKDAFIDEVRVLMSDSARLAGREAERTEGRYLRVNRGVYSPCRLCADDPDAPPLWQLRSARSVHDNQEHVIRHRDVTLEMYGVPVFYTPYFSHPDPTVDRQSGFLAPVFGSSSDLGSFLRTAYYIDITPETDATVYLTAFSGSMPLFGGQVRHRFETGALEIEGSVTQSTFIPTADPSDQGSEQVRGNLFATGRFDIDDNWRWGGDLNVLSDFNFLREYYDFDDENYLQSRGYVEGFFLRDYFRTEAFRFEPLVPNAPEAPTIFPNLEYSLVGEPAELLGGRWSLDLGARGVMREDGADSTRLTIDPGWRAEWITGFGLVATVDAHVRADVFSFRDYVAPDTPDEAPRSAMEYRVLPEAQIAVRYPWHRPGGWFDTVIEPKVALTMAPDLFDQTRFPNEDSLDIELNESRLFALNRFSGADRQEGGQRVAYGLGVSFFAPGGERLNLFGGQSYRLSDTSPFSPGSGLDSRRSDWVGSIELVPTSWMDLFYGFRLDNETLEPERHTIRSTIGVPLFRFGVDYNFIENQVDPNQTARDDREFATVAVSSQLTEDWRVWASHDHTFNPDAGPRKTSLNLTYQDECFTFEARASRDYTSIPGVSDGVSVFFRLVFKNLGEVTSPSLSPAGSG